MTVDVFLFAIADKKDTGLPYDIAIWMGKVKKGTPQIGIWTGASVIPVSISDEPKVLSENAVLDFEAVSDFVKKNREVLLDHWNGKLTDRETLNLLKKISATNYDCRSSDA